MPTHSHPSTQLRRHDDLRVPACGETVAATRIEPTGYDDPLPAVLMYVPYPRDDVITYGAYDPLVRYLAEHGYEVVVADMVGSGGSTGFLEELFTRREGHEPAAIVEWLADRDWTDGRVGMVGKSYGGITALDAAAQQPDALDAIVPIHTPYEGVRNAYTHGGAFELLNIGMNWLTVMQALEVKPPSWRDADGRWAEAWKTRLERVPDRDPFVFQFLDHAMDDDYWADKRIPVEDIETPTFAVTGWRDSYTRDTFEYVDAIDAPTRTIAGPWRHTMPHRGRESAVDFRWQVVSWFDRFLKDAESGVLDWPAVRYWTERDGGHEPGSGVWRGREAWPTTEAAVAGSTTATDAAGSDGDAADAPTTRQGWVDHGTRVETLSDGGTDPADETVGFALSSEGLVDADAFEREGGGRSVERTYGFDHAVGLAAVDPSTATLERVDTHADDARSLAFETDPLDAPLELTGTGHATLRLSSTAADHLVVVRLVDVAPDGTGTPVTHGIVRTTHRSGGDGAPTPGEEYDLTVPLQPRSHVLEPGHRLRVAVSAAYFPLVLPSKQDGELTVRSTPARPSRVVVPGTRRDDADFADRVEMDGPDESRPVSSTATFGQSGSWEVTRERDGDAVRMEKTTEYGIDVPHADRVTRRESYTATVTADDPASAVAESEVEMTVEYATETVRVVAANTIAPDLTEVTTQVFRGDRTVLDETWIR